MALWLLLWGRRGRRWCPHRPLSGAVQVCHELLVGEEEEKEEEQGRQEVEREGQSEENTRTWMTMWMVVKGETQT